MKLCLPEIPSQYWITKLNLKCRKCCVTFSVLLPRGDEIVKFREVDGDTIKWLPMYGVGGYLDLLTRLVPGYKADTEVTMKTAGDFAKALASVAEKSAHGKHFEVDYGKIKCPACTSTDPIELSEEILENPQLDWLRVSCD